MNLSTSNLSNSPNSNTLVFIDTNVDNYQSLIPAVSTTENTEVVLLDSTRDGIEQITETLVNYSELDSIHIVSHGEAGNLQLGSTNLQAENLNDYSALLQSWSDSLSEDADILLYGCEIGATAQGIEFLGNFGELTQADVAASEDLTGKVELGGDWELEVATGEIEATSVYSNSFDAYDSVLAIEYEFYPSNDDVSEPAIDFDFFGDTRDLTFNGDAVNHDGALSLTSTEKQQQGSVFHQTAKEIDTNTSFSTQFQFQISGGANGADGLTFMLQNDQRGAAAVGKGGAGLGYQDIDNSLAIEFDTFANPQWDANNNHVSILQDGEIKVPLATSAAPVDLNGGGLLNAWIDYNGQNDLLQVYLGDTLDKPDAALLSFNIDLTAVVGARAFLGFSAGTGGLSNSHDVYAWSVDWNPNLPVDNNGNDGNSGATETPDPVGETEIPINESNLNTLVDFNNFANTERLKLNYCSTPQLSN